MLLFHLDKSKQLPLYQQIINQIKQLIDSATWKTGHRLPSSRELAEDLGVNRSTVYRAYQELWAQGYIDCTPGTYTTVRYQKKINNKQISRSDPKINWEKQATKKSKKLFQASKDMIHQHTTGDLIDFVSLSPDPRLFPVDDFRRCQNQVMRRIGASLLQYGDPFGYNPLREYIAQRQRQYGINVSPGEILITNGVQQAFNLVCQFLLEARSSVVVEEPTYPSVLSVLDLYETKAIGVNQEESGLDLDLLEELFKKQQPVFLYTMPNFQNPTGITTSHAHREKLLSICENAGVLIIEDGFEEELKYFGKAVLPLKSLDQKGIVIYLGTFSKVLFPGLRIGWIAANRECINRLAPLKQVNDTAGNIMEQAALECYCQSGDFEIHVKRMHREYRKRMKSALSLAKQCIPSKHFNYTLPSGGYTLWVEAKNTSFTEEALIEKLLQAGVRVAPGSKFFSGKRDIACFRISIAHCNQEEIEFGFKKLGDVLTALVKRS